MSCFNEDPKDLEDLPPETPPLPPDHPLYVDPTKKLTRFDLILMNNYKSIESYSSPYSSIQGGTSSSSGYTSSKSLNEIDKHLSTSTSISTSATIPDITTTRCSTSSDNEDEEVEEEQGSDGSPLSSDEDLTYPHHGYHRPQPLSVERSFSEFGSLSTIPEVPTPNTPLSNLDDAASMEEIENYENGIHHFEDSFETDRRASAPSIE